MRTRRRGIWGARVIAALGLLSLVWFLGSPSAHLAAQATPATASGVQPRAVAAGRLPLWKAEGARNTVYLLGAVHLLKKDDYPLPEPIEAAFRASSIVVFETDFATLESSEAQRKLAEQARLPSGRTLERELPGDTYARLQAELAAMGLPRQTFDRLKPGVAALAMEVFALQRRGFRPEYGLDQYFFNRARRAGKEILSLETVDYQIQLATDFTRDEGERMLESTLSQGAEERRRLDDILRAWRAGDAAGLVRLFEQARAQSPELFERLVGERNRRWLPRILELLDGTRDAMVIVGTAHVVGPGGLVDLLTEAGVTTEQVRSGP